MADRTARPEGTIGIPSIRRRLASLLYESLLMLGVLSVAFMVPHVAMGMAFGWVAPSFVLVIHLAGVLAAYFLWYWQHGGQTLAMQTWRIVLVATEGGPAPISRLVLRFLLAWPSLLFYGVGIIWAILDRDRQFLHDRLAGTRIVFKQ